MSAPATQAAAPDSCIAMLGRLGTPQLACLRSWRRAGVDAVFLHADETPLSPRVARLLGVDAVDLGPLRLDDAGFVARLADVLGDRRVTALTCVSEPIAEALWACRPRLPAGLRVAAAHPSATQRLQSKAFQDELARRCGLPTLPTWLLAPGQMARLPDDAYPVVARPDVARRADPPFKLAVLPDRRALQRLVSAQRIGASAIIVQPLRQGPNLLVHAWRSADGRIAGQLGFTVTHKHGGLTVAMQPCPLPAPLAEGCARMADELGLCGVFHFEFIVDAVTGQAYFLDLNPRLGGTTGKVLAAGYDEPLALLATLQPGAWPRTRFIAPRLHAAGGLHQAAAALVSALRGRSTVADHPWPGTGRVIQSVAAQALGARDELLQPRELRSLLGFVLHHAAGRLARRRQAATGVAVDSARSPR
jgi:hypothetical protein